MTVLGVRIAFRINGFFGQKQGMATYIAVPILEVSYARLRRSGHVRYRATSSEEEARKRGSPEGDEAGGVCDEQGTKKTGQTHEGAGPLQEGGKEGELASCEGSTGQSRLSPSTAD
jgi:hypothetical protein